MALFQHEDALILGMLFAEFFPAYVYPLNEGEGEFDNWSGGGGGGIHGKRPEYSTGRGGITRKKDGSVGVNGEPGRPGANDAVTKPAEPSLCGDGGYIDGGGSGLGNGQLFFGGNATNVTEPVFNISSAGGGSGLFGGGSAYILAGGGGGSTWVYSETGLGEQGWKAIKDILPNLEYPEWLDIPRWIGIDLSTMQYFKNNEELFDVNTYHEYEYRYEGLPNRLGPAYDPFFKLHKDANGNGLILISKVNERIQIDRANGQITGIGEIVEYSGQTVAWTPEVEGEYEFILWGAQGGTAMYTRPDDANTPGQSFTGGFGGSCGFFITLSPTHIETIEGVETEVPTTLYLRVGERGSYTRLRNAWNGGGNADTATGGGGSTSVCWQGRDGDTSWQSFYEYRLAVAGGGGGCLGTGHGGTPVMPIQKGEPGNPKEILDDEDVIINPVEDDEPLYFLVNDLSLVYVTINYYSSASLPSNSHAGCLLYINNGQEGVLYQEFRINPVSGLLELVFPLDQVYPENTKTHWVTLTPEIRTNTQFLIPDGGVHIRVETRKRVNEANVELFRPLVLRVLETLKLVDTWNVELVGQVEDINLSIVENLKLIDTIELTLRAVQLVHEYVVEKLSVIDKNKVSLGSEPSDDIELSILDNLKLIDLFHQAFEEEGDFTRSNSDTASMVDSVNVLLRQVEKMYLTITEKLSAVDDTDIEEE